MTTRNTLDAETAAAIAKRHGLSLSDALALRGLTDDADEADQLAGQFAAEDSTAIADRVQDGGLGR